MAYLPVTKDPLLTTCSQRDRQAYEITTKLDVQELNQRKQILE